MLTFRRHAREVRTPRFVQCAGCSYDFLSGEGTRACNWFECPLLPADFNVFCSDCNYNFATEEGRSRCGDPPVCEQAIEGREHARKAIERFQGPVRL